MVEYGSTDLYNKYVVDPVTDKLMKNNKKLFSMAGIDGCTGSVDATHVQHHSCAHWCNVLHTSWKSKKPYRTYNTTVSH